MGNCHFNAYNACKGARIKALSDIDNTKVHADAEVAGSIVVGAAQSQPSRLNVYTNADDLLADCDADVVDIIMPAYRHAEYAIRAR